MNRWDTKYEQLAALPCPEPDPLLIRAVEGLRPGRALDLACGRGQNAGHLADKLWEVDAVDYSRVPLEQVGSKERIRAICADLESSGFKIEPATYDLICCIRFLFRPLFQQIAAGMKPGGLFVARIASELSSINPLYRLHSGELAEAFHGWEFLHYRESVDAELIARKPDDQTSLSGFD